MLYTKQVKEPEETYDGFLSVSCTIPHNLKWLTLFWGQRQYGKPVAMLNKLTYTVAIRVYERLATSHWQPRGCEFNPSLDVYKMYNDGIGQIYGNESYWLNHVVSNWALLAYSVTCCFFLNQYQNWLLTEVYICIYSYCGTHKVLMSTVSSTRVLEQNQYSVLTE